MLTSGLGCVDVSAVVVVDVAVSSGADSMVPLCSGRGEGSFLFVEDPWLSAGSCESLCFVVGVDVSVSSLKVLLVFVLRGLRDFLCCRLSAPGLDSGLGCAGFAALPLPFLLRCSPGRPAGVVCSASCRSALRWLSVMKVLRWHAISSASSEGWR